MAELLRQKEMLLHEMQHRVAKSLQIIASILLLKVRFSSFTSAAICLDMMAWDWHLIDALMRHGVRSSCV
jgi:hypothetical protein